MKHITALILAALLLAPLAVLHADDSAELAAFFAPAVERGGTFTIPPGDYELDGKTPLKLASRMTPNLLIDATWISDMMCQRRTSGLQQLERQKFPTHG